MPTTQIPQTVADWREGGVDVRLNSEGGLPDCTVGFVARDANGANADRAQRPFDLARLTATERSNFAAIVKKIARLSSATALNVADPATLVESPNWVFSEP